MILGTEAIIWLCVLLLLLFMEAATVGLTTIWFAGGALVACIMAIADFGLLTQIIVFLVVSVLMLVFTRPLAMRYINKNREVTNVNSLIGKTAVVTERIENLASRGQVQVDGQFWSARSETDDNAIETGRTVTIQKITGVKLIVKEN